MPATRQVLELAGEHRSRYSKTERLNLWIDSYMDCDESATCSETDDWLEAVNEVYSQFLIL